MLLIFETKLLGVIAMSDDYKPSIFDLQWTKSMLDQMNDGATWAMPMNGMVWRFDHSNKELILVDGPKDYMFNRITKNFSYYGYTVKDGRSNKC